MVLLNLALLQATMSSRRQNDVDYLDGSPLLVVPNEWASEDHWQDHLLVALVLTAHGSHLINVKTRASSYSLVVSPHSRREQRSATRKAVSATTARPRVQVAPYVPNFEENLDKRCTLLNSYRETSSTTIYLEQ